VVVFADLLNKDFNVDPKFTLTTYAKNGAVSINNLRSLFVFPVENAWLARSVGSLYWFRFDFRWLGVGF
jgi:hypothetical protein